MNIFQRPFFRVMCVGLLAVGIVGCGNKGPLVLPAKPAPVAAPAIVEPPPVVEPEQDPAVLPTDPAGEQPAAASDVEPGY